MKFFTYAPKARVGLLWGHLHNISAMAESTASTDCKFTHTFEILSSAMSGSFDLDQDRFDHLAYEAKSRKNDEFNQINKAKKQSNIVDSVIDSESPKSYRDVRADTVLVGMEEAFDKIDASETLRESIIELAAMRQVLFQELRMDVITAIQGSLGDNPDAIDAVREICERKPDVGELIIDILQSVKDLADGGESVDLHVLLSNHSQA